MSHDIEEGSELKLNWSKLQSIASTGRAVVPVVVQHADTHEVLIVAYANEQALQETMQRGRAVFWSTSRNELWIKGQTSGDWLELVEVRVNCEQNSLLYLVRPQGQGTCHTNKAQGTARSGCYYRRLNDDGTLENLQP